MKRSFIFNLFKNKKGLTLIEAMIALVILVFPIMATLSSVSFLYKQTNSRNLELLAENLSNYILEDLRGRKFYYISGETVTVKDNLQFLYENLPNKYGPLTDPFGSEGDRYTRYSYMKELHDISDPYYVSDSIDDNDIEVSNPYIDFDFTGVDLSKFYNAYHFELYITRYINGDISEPASSYDPYKFLYKIDLKIYWKEGKRNRLLKNSTEVTFHDP